MVVMKNLSQLKRIQYNKHWVKGENKHWVKGENKRWVKIISGRVKRKPHNNKENGNLRYLPGMYLPFLRSKAVPF